MAKQMFYTLQEAAERLGVDEQAVKSMAAEGKVQQFRDRDQLMFKRDEIEKVADGGAPAADATETGGAPASGGADDSGEISLADEFTSEPAPPETPPAASPSPEDSGTIPLADDGTPSSGMGLKIDDAGPSGDTADAGDSGTGTGTIDLADEGAGLSSGLGEKDPNQGTGVSVFDADEVEDADPMAQTQVNRPVVGDEEAAIENVGSGSGLLDLTRESDDTSLGAAELLDEIYPSEASVEGTSIGPGQSGVGPSPAADDSAMGSAIGSSGVLEATQAATDPGTEDAADFETLGGATQMEQVDLGAGGEALSEATLPAGYYEPDDPVGSGFGGGMLVGATLTLVVGMLVTLSALLDVRLGVMEQMTESANALLIWCGGLLVFNIVCGVVGLVIGKAIASASAAAQPVASAAE